MHDYEEELFDNMGLYRCPLMRYEVYGYQVLY